MSDSKLDDAIMREAIHRAMIGGAGNTENAILIAIDLTRKGWTPPDPLEAEIHALVHWYSGQQGGWKGWCDLARKALERGIEIGRVESIQPSAES